MLNSDVKFNNYLIYLFLLHFQYDVRILVYTIKELLLLKHYKNIFFLKKV